ncbi:hypothetical protein Patl1_11296 [Pistacia atlantica]|uniref:Uncharacterized protein n=1 Tax=Pistacia atlantica TaxID=434234 RepID=A0ACC1A0N1_9ROSI|nr:hypothetical protein Patl1_11296 [Pistacia atlantica]
MDLFLLPLVGCDSILGAHWLRTLGTILWDFHNLQMEFELQGRQCVLHENNLISFLCCNSLPPPFLGGQLFQIYLHHVDLPEATLPSPI